MVATHTPSPGAERHRIYWGPEGVVYRLERRLYLIEVQGRITPAVYRVFNRAVHSDTELQRPYAVVYDQSGLEGYDMATAEVGRMPEFRGRMADFVVLCTTSLIERMMAHSVAVALKALGQSELRAVSTVDEGLAHARAFLADNPGV